MDEMKIEYLTVAAPSTDPTANRYVKVPVVRLEQVDKLIGEAVWAMQRIQFEEMDWPDEPEYQRAHAFLASPLVAAWRTRQEGKK